MGQFRVSKWARPEYQTHPTLSFDGTALYFSSKRNGKAETYRRTLATGELQRITDGGGQVAREWPGQNRLIYASADNYLRALPIGQTGEGSILDQSIRPNVLWTLSRDRIYFNSSDFDLTAYSPDGRIHPVVRLANPLVPYVASLEVSPDGRFLAFATRDHDETDIKLRVGPIP